MTRSVCKSKAYMYISMQSCENMWTRIPQTCHLDTPRIIHRIYHICHTSKLLEGVKWWHRPEANQSGEVQLNWKKQKNDIQTSIEILAPTHEQVPDLCWLWMLFAWHFHPSFSSYQLRDLTSIAASSSHNAKALVEDCFTAASTNTQKTSEIHSRMARASSGATWNHLEVESLDSLNPKGFATCQSLGSKRDNLCELQLKNSPSMLCKCLQG